jgi:uncharacterized caspase-like protein
VSPVPASPAQREASALLSELFVQLKRGSGASVLAASGGAEFALESGEWTNGVFTHAVRRGLERGEADIDHDGVVTVSELKEFVARAVERLTYRRQRPVARRENLQADFPLEVVGPW